jgi:hypothetical protein
MLDFSLEVPAGHLAQRKPAAKFVRRNIFLPFTNLVGNVKSFADREFNAMENGSICSSFLSLTFGTAPRKRFLSRTGVGIAAFLTHKTICPFNPRQKFEAFSVASKHFFQLFRTKAIAEYWAHKLIFPGANVNKFSVTKKIQVILMRFNLFFY